MAITNKVTRADKVWAGSRGLLGLLSQPAASGSGIGVAVIDSGIADHAALTGRVVARVNLVSHEPGVTGDPFGHGTHIAGMIGGSAAAATRVTPDYAGGSAPGVHFVDVRVLGSNGAGYTSDVIAGIDWTIANARRYGIRIINLSLGHPVTEPSATDPLCRAVARAVARRARRGRLGRQLRTDGDRHADPRRHHVARQLAVRHHRRRARRHGHRRSRRRSRRRLQLARADEVRLRGQARRRGARRRHRLARESVLVAEHALSRMARRRQRPQRLLPAERHQHVGRRRQRRRRAAPRRRAAACRRRR